MTNPPIPIPIISFVTPSNVKRGSLVQINNLAGSNFLTGAKVNLTWKGDSYITASNVVVPTLSQITGTFNLDGVSSGIWNVSVANPNGKIGSHINGFTVIPNNTAKFYRVPGTIVNPLTINFYDASETSPTRWSWSFGDGQSATTRNATHMYSTVKNLHGESQYR